MAGTRLTRRAALRAMAGALLAAPVLHAAAAAGAPQRVVIADGVATEIAFLLGAGARIVGVDETSSYPPEAREKARLGYFRRLAAEGVLGLAPDLMIASPHAGPPAAIARIREAGVPVVVTPEVLGLAGLPEKIRVVGAALGLAAEAEALAAKTAARVAALEAGRPVLAAPPRVLFVLGVRDGAPVVIGTGTAADAVIRLAGGVNAAGLEGYRPMSREAIIAAAPDLILMSEEHAAVVGGPGAVLARPEFALTPAGRAGAALTLPALAIMGIGPRTPAAVERLRAALAP
ncbi:hemin ABC transporter substrate-binding protein [Paralimibaculum aggregatum]|uniref:Hemin ABC transporter substrate-binding protein n=1 Tax=Paralimibaculum aggregatum TaxID=3036245 RepID=A0ABQ6LQ20_9RHOB|nr:ABC transporter substrate-binding protein [Limibaculum sp. NKW23]GMG83533.1 hemin ABC transporter substrate-binding protein [Limibaculum sp. NKW23]